MPRLLSLFLLLSFHLCLSAAEPVFSGPQPGEKLTPFKVLGSAGPHAGKEVELLGQLKGAPTVLVFVHEATRPGLQLLRLVDYYGSKLAPDGLATHFLWLTADKSKTEDYLNRAKKSLGLKSPVSISLDGIEGPGNYGLNRKMTLTILVAKDNKVTANFAIVQPNETDAPKVLAAVAKLMGKPAPSVEQLQKELGGGRRPEAKPDAIPPELQALLRRMIQKDNDEAAVREIAQAMVKWAGDDAPKKTQLKASCKRILDLGYGNDLAKKALKRLAGD